MVSNCRITKYLCCVVCFILLILFQIDLIIASYGEHSAKKA